MPSASTSACQPQDAAPKRSRRQDRERPCRGQERERAGSGGSSGSGDASGGGGGGTGGGGASGGSGGSANGGAAFNMLAMLAAAQQGAGEEATTRAVEVEMTHLEPSDDTRSAHPASTAAAREHRRLRHQDDAACPPTLPPQTRGLDSPPQRKACPQPRDQPVDGSALRAPASVMVSPPAGSKQPSSPRPPLSRPAVVGRGEAGGGAPTQTDAGSRNQMGGDARGAAFNLRAMLDAAGLDGDQDGPEDIV